MYVLEIWDSCKTELKQNYSMGNFFNHLLHGPCWGDHNKLHGDWWSSLGLDVNVDKRMIHFRITIMQGKRGKLSHIVYRLLKRLHGIGDLKAKWIVKIKDTLENRGYSNMCNATSAM